MTTTRHEIMSISILYEQARTNTSFFIMTGLTQHDFDLLLPFFNITCAKKLTKPQQLFAALHAEHCKLGAEKIGQLIPYVNYKRDGQTFLNQAQIALTKARANIASNQSTISPVMSTSNIMPLTGTQPSTDITPKKISRKKTNYVDNLTIGLACERSGKIEPQAIIEHAQRRIDMFFYTLILYYKSNLTVQIDDTIFQHGAGTNQTAACHSAILPALWETEILIPSHQMNTRNNPLMMKKKTSILDGTHFQQSINSTVELHQSVNYFETHYLEGKKSENKMRNKALAIINRVSNETINPTQGMLEFLIALNLTFNNVKKDYFTKSELKTSPKETRSCIFDCEKKGSFQSTWHENMDTNHPTLNDDYVDTMLQLNVEDKRVLTKKADETCEDFLKRFDKDQSIIYEKKYALIKQEISSGTNALFVKKEPVETPTKLAATRGLFSCPNIKDPIKKDIEQAKDPNFN